MAARFDFGEIFAQLSLLKASRITMFWMMIAPKVDKADWSAPCEIEKGGSAEDE